MLDQFEAQVKLQLRFDSSFNEGGGYYHQAMRGGGIIKILHAASEALAEASPLALILVGLGAVAAFPALKRGLGSAADAVNRGFRETSEAMSEATANLKSGWGAVVGGARSTCANVTAGQVGTMTGAAIGGVIGASAGGPLGAGLGAVVGGSLGQTVGCRRAAQPLGPTDTGDSESAKGATAGATLEGAQG